MIIKKINHNLIDELTLFEYSEGDLYASFQRINEVNIFKKSRGNFVITPISPIHLGIIKAIDSKIDFPWYGVNAEFLIVKSNKNYSKKIRRNQVKGIIIVAGSLFSHETDYCKFNINNGMVQLRSKHKNRFFGDESLWTITQDYIGWKKVKIYTAYEALQEINSKGHMPLNEPFSVIFNEDELNAINNNEPNNGYLIKEYGSLLEHIMYGSPKISDLINQKIKSENSYSFNPIGYDIGSMITAGPNSKFQLSNNTNYPVSTIFTNHAIFTDKIADLGMKIIKGD